MSKYTIRHKVSVSIGGADHSVIVRELPYQRFLDINNGVGLPEDGRGAAVMRALCVAALEEADGTKSFTDESFAEEPMSAQKALHRAVLKAHGVDLDKVIAATGMTEAEIEGNA